MRRLCTRMVLLEVAVLGLGSSASALGEAANADFISMVREGHPRLMLLDKDLRRLRRDLKKNPCLARWYKKVRASAVRSLDASQIDYEPRERGIMLGSARRAVERIYALGLVHRVEGDGRFARRAAEVLLHACKQDGWNPGHFLDTAELTHAVGIGYDWFYKDLTPEQRTVIRNGICRNGLTPGLHFLESTLPVVVRYRYFNWARANNNWNQVCNGGMTIGALAVADEAPELAGRVLTRSLRSIRLAMKEFAPDGGWAEGPGYWSYATRYNAYFLAALETAIGPDAIQPYLGMPGFGKTGEFRIHLVGPTGLTFNFADAHEGAGPVAQMFWLAQKFERPVYADHADRFASSSPHEILWYTPAQTGPRKAKLPLDAYFRHVEVVFLRSAWEDRDAVYVGFKGGDNRVSHSHLDLGSFVLDVDGRRWALDLGRDHYALPGYFYYGKTTYYRLKTEGHNTLLLNGQNQQPNARASIVAFRSRKDRAFAVVDLSQAYRGAARQVRRGIALLKRRDVLVQDELSFEAPAEVVWQMHTRAKITPKGRTAVLRQGARTLRASILTPEDAVFEIQSANPPLPQGQQPDVSKLVVRLKLPAGEARLAVLLSPRDRSRTHKLRPLTEWIREADDTKER